MKILRKLWNSKNFSRDAMMVIYIMSIRVIVDLFLDSYVSTAISQLQSESNSFLVGYYLAKYTTMAILAIALGPWLKASYKRMLQIGTITSIFFFLCFSNMGNSMIAFWATAVLEGVSLMLFYLPAAVMIAKHVSAQERHKYSARSATISNILSFIFPTILGWIIIRFSYIGSSVCMIVVLLLQIWIISQIKEKSEVEKNSYSFLNFIKKMPKKEIKLFGLMAICRGITINGAQQQLTNLLIFAKLGNEFSLGIAKSMISLVGIIGMIMFERFASKKTYRKTIIICLIIQVMCTIWLLVNCNFASVISIRICLATVTTIVGTIASNCVYDMFAMHDAYSAEYATYNEFCLNIGRICSWILTAVALLFTTENGNNFAVAIAMINVFFIILIAVLNTLIKKLYISEIE